MTHTACAHCGLPAARGQAPSDGSLAFCCVGCALAFRIAGAEGDEGAARWLMARFLLATLFGVAVMMLSLILWSGTIYGADWESHPLGQLTRWGLLALATPVLFLLIPPLLAAERAGSWRRLLTLDAWILIGASSAYLLSAWRVLAGSGDVYFESAAMVLVLVTLGRYLDARAKVRTGEAAAQLRALLPETTRRADGREVAVESLAVEDRLLLKAGDRVPCDGVVYGGASLVDFAVLTGESEPIPARPGDAVRAGGHLVDGALELKVTATAGERVLDRIAEALESARGRRTPRTDLADRLAAWLLPAVFALATGLLLYYGMAGDWETGLLRALAALLVSCPCSLGIATPLALWSGVGRALRHGILVREAGVLERLPTLRSVALDKTGTLTTGEKTLARIASLGCEEAEARRLAALLEAAADHPVARALADPAIVGELPSPFRVLPGRGVAGTLDGEELLLGNRHILEDACDLPDSAMTAWVDAESEGLSVVALASRDRGLLALFLLEETLRPEAAGLVAELRARSLRVEILTGDSAGAASRLGESLGVPVRAALLPEDKERIVGGLAEDAGPVLFVGDGINDAPAMARADASIAVAGGADIARSASDVVLLRDDLDAVSALLGEARSTVRRMRFNFGWALFYNPLFLYLAATGRIAPVACAAAMAASSLFVVTQSLAGQNNSSPWAPSHTPSSSDS